MERVNELYILIPMVNNLKGILEMNLSSRLSTSVGLPFSIYCCTLLCRLIFWYHFPGKHRRTG